jgi:hypothetical protein
MNAEFLAALQHAPVELSGLMSARIVAANDSVPVVHSCMRQAHQSASA